MVTMPSSDQRTDQSPPAPQMCVAVDSTQPLRQGDIFARTSDPQCQPFGIVVTNDCDIVRDKAWRLLTWVPIVPATSYLASRWAYEELGRLSTALKTTLLSAVKAAREKRSAPPLSADALDSWLRRLTQSTLADPFALGDDVAAERRLHAQFDRHAEALASFHALLERLPPRHEPWPPEIITQVFETLHLLKVVNTATFKHESLTREIQNALASHPEDVFPLFSVLDSDPDGHVVLLRFLREVDQTTIGLQAGDAIQRGLQYHRVAKLVSPYVYDLTRRLGAVFSDIGLPQPYTDHKKASALRIAQRLFGCK